MLLAFCSIYADPYNELFTGKACNPVEEPALKKLYANFSKATITAEFTQKSFVKALNKELLSNGKLIFIPDKAIFWETTSPYKQSLYISKNGEVFEKGKPDPVGVFRYGSLMSEMIHSGADNLSEAFELYFLLDGSDWFMGLKPKKRAIGKFISNIVIAGNQEGKIRELHIMGKDAKITEIIFKNHQSPSAEEVNGIHEIFNQK